MSVVSDRQCVIRYQLRFCMCRPYCRLPNQIVFAGVCESVARRERLWIHGHIPSTTAAHEHNKIVLRRKRVPHCAPPTQHPPRPSDETTLFFCFSFFFRGRNKTCPISVYFFSTERTQHKKCCCRLGLRPRVTCATSFEEAISYWSCLSDDTDQIDHQ